MDSNQSTCVIVLLSVMLFLSSVMHGCIRENQNQYEYRLKTMQLEKDKK